jgi:hypothetical protein
MWAAPLAFWILFPAFYGAVHGAIGYDPGAADRPQRGLVVLPGFLAAWAAVVIVFLLVGGRVAHGRWD